MHFKSVTATNFSLHILYLIYALQLQLVRSVLFTCKQETSINLHTPIFKERKHEIIIIIRNIIANINFHLNVRLICSISTQQDQ